MNTIRNVLAGLSLLLIGLAPLGAQVPVGPSFEVTTLETRGYNPFMGMADDGSFVVAWRAQYNSIRGNVARRYNADGTPAGDPILVSYAGGDSLVGMAGDGTFVVALYDAYRVYYSDGTITPEIPIPTAGDISEIGIRNDHSVVLVTSSRSGSWPSWSFSTEINVVSPSGVVIENFAIPIGETSSIYNRNLDIADDGSFILTFSCSGRMDSNCVEDLYAVHYNASTGTFNYHTVLSGYSSFYGSIGLLAGIDAGGNYTIVYPGIGSNRYNWMVYAAKYDSNGILLYNDLIHTIPDVNNWKESASLAMLDDGSFVLAYGVQDATRLTSLEAVTFNSDGTPKGAPITIEIADSGMGYGDGYVGYVQAATNGDRLAFAWYEEWSSSPGWHAGVTGRVYSIGGPATPAAMTTTVANMLTDGLIANGGVANALISSLDNAQAQLDSGNTRAAINMLDSLINRIRAQSGRQIDADAAAELIGYLEAMIANL